jgi:hypothetical protein
MNMDDIFSQFVIFSAVPWWWRIWRRRRQRSRTKGSNPIKVKLTLEEVNGVEKSK